MYKRQVYRCDEGRVYTELERYRLLLRQIGGIPVSYTHLDVYKRQLLHLADGGLFVVPLCLHRVELFPQLGKLLGDCYFYFSNYRGT